MRFVSKLNSGFLILGLSSIIIFKQHCDLLVQGTENEALTYMKPLRTAFFPINTDKPQDL